MSELSLGFPVERESAWLVNRYFPSKVGGKPAWLDLDHLPPKEALICVLCQKPKVFLCQIYAPLDAPMHFHRTLFLFTCRNESCQQSNSSESLTVLRGQLPRENSFYSATPPADDDSQDEALPSVQGKQTLCHACGCAGPMACSRCLKSFYCSADHQRLHWRYHKKLCAPATSEAAVCDWRTVVVPGIEFPEWEIAIENSDDGECAARDEEDEDSKDAERMAEYEKMVASGQAGSLDDVPASELERYIGAAETTEDKHFREFKRITVQDKEQIIRYQRKSSPLWIADPDKTVGTQTATVPKCANCGAERVFEFQVMPQMLLLLEDDHLDWGILAVYTCTDSCQPPEGVGYLQEYIVKQDILQETPTIK